MDNYMIVKILKIKILKKNKKNKNQKNLVKDKVKVECNKFKKKMMKKKQKEDMQIYINQEEPLYNFYKKVEM